MVVKTSIAQLRSRAYQFLPFEWVHPHIHKSMKAYKKGDKRENLESRLPDGEFLKLKCVWAIEFYTPSHTEKLYSSITKLGWDKPSDLHRERSLVNWFSRRREHPWGEGWYNVGLVRPLNYKHEGFLHGDYKSELPEGVEYALVDAYSITSSLTCIVICFAYNEIKQLELNNILEKSLSTYPKALGKRIIAWESPSNQRIKLISKLRLKNRSEIHNWFSKHLPGQFSSDEFEYHVPTCELITTKESIFSISEERKSLSFLWFLGLEKSYDTWVYKGLSSFSFKWPIDNRHSHESEFHSSLAVSETELTSLIMKKPYVQSMEAASTDWAHIHHLNDSVPTLVSLWAIQPLLLSYERHVANLRDKLPLKSSAKRGLVNISNILEDMLQKSISIESVTGSLVKLSNSSFFGHDLLDIERLDKLGSSEHPDKLRNVLKFNINHRATSIQRLDKSLRDLLMQYGNIVSTRENMILQTRMKWLTISALFLAFVTLVAADNAKANLMSAWSTSSQWAQKAYFKSMVFFDTKFSTSENGQSS